MTQPPIGDDAPPWVRNKDESVGQPVAAPNLVFRLLSRDGYDGRALREERLMFALETLKLPPTERSPMATIEQHDRWLTAQRRELELIVQEVLGDDLWRCVAHGDVGPLGHVIAEDEDVMGEGRARDQRARGPDQQRSSNPSRRVGSDVMGEQRRESAQPKGEQGEPLTSVNEPSEALEASHGHPDAIQPKADERHHAPQRHLGTHGAARGVIRHRTNRPVEAQESPR